MEQEYLPPGAKSGEYYQPTEHGHEAKFKQRLERLRGAGDAEVEAGGGEGQ